MAQSLSADEFADVEVQLSKDFAWLLPRDPAVEARRWRAAGLIADPADRDLRPRRRLSSGVVLMVASPDPRLPRSARTGSCDPLLPKPDRPA